MCCVASEDARELSLLVAQGSGGPVDCAPTSVICGADPALTRHSKRMSCFSAVQSNSSRHLAVTLNCRFDCLRLSERFNDRREPLGSAASASSAVMARRIQAPWLKRSTMSAIFTVTASWTRLRPSFCLSCRVAGCQRRLISWPASRVGTSHGDVSASRQSR